MKPFILILLANETRAVTVSGDYFELRTAAAALDLVELLDANNGVIGYLDEAEATDYLRTKTQFSQVRIKNGATPQTIRFYHGTGDSGSNRFTGVVSGEVALDAATLAAIDASVVAARKPYAKTGYQNTAAGLAANTPETVFLAAANPNGVIVTAAALASLSGGNVCGFGGLLAKATAPANITDGQVIAPIRPMSYEPANLKYIWGVDLNHDVFVPAGMGLFWISDVALSANPRSVSWKAL